MPTRRDWLKGAAGLLLVRDALAQGRIEPGVRRSSGEVRISGERIVTGADGEVVFVVQQDAFLVRKQSEVSLVKTGLRILSGAVLSVFQPKQPKEIRTETAVIGIRGTGIYVEAEPARTYVCTCYGESLLEPIGDPGSRESVRTQHHEQPRYIMAKGAPQMMMRAPVINHTDAELVFLESLLGREPPFLGKGFKPY